MGERRCRTHILHLSPPQVAEGVGGTATVCRLSPINEPVSRWQCEIQNSHHQNLDPSPSEKPTGRSGNSCGSTQGSNGCFQEQRCRIQM